MKKKIEIFFDQFFLRQLCTIHFRTSNPRNFFQKLDHKSINNLAELFKIRIKNPKRPLKLKSFIIQDLRSKKKSKKSDLDDLINFRIDTIKGHNKSINKLMKISNCPIEINYENSTKKNIL